MAENKITLQVIESIAKETNAPIEDVADAYGFDLKKKESTEPSSLSSQEDALESTTQSTEEPPVKKKRGSVVSKKPNQVQPSVSSTGKEDKNVYYYNVNPKIGTVESEPEVPKGYTTVKKVENSKEVELWKKQKANQGEGILQKLKEQKQDKNFTGKEELIEARTQVLDRPKLKAVSEAEKLESTVYNPKTQRVEVKPVELPKIDFGSPKLMLSVESLEEIDKQLSKTGVGIKTIKYGNMEFKANSTTAKDFKIQESNWYNSAKSKVGDISITSEDLKSIEEEYNSKLNRTNILDETEDFVRQSINTLSAKTTGELAVDLKGDNFADIRQQLMAEDPKFKTLKPEERVQKVKDRFFENQQDALLLNKYYDAAEKLTPQERFAITKRSRNLLQATEKENKKEYDKVSALSLSLDKLVEKRKQIEQVAKTAKDKDQFQSLRAEYDKNEALISGYYSEYAKSRENYYKSADKIKNLKTAVSGYSAETNEFLEMSKRVKAWGWGTVANMYQFGKDFAKDIGLPLLGEEDAQKDVQKIIDISKENKEEMLSEVREVKDVTNTSTTFVSSFLNKTVNVFGDGLGMVGALTIAGPTSGTMFLSLDTVGAQLGNIEDQNRQFKKSLYEAKDSGKDKFVFDGKEYDVKENEGKDLYGRKSAWTSAALYGAAMNLPLAFQAKTIFNPVLRNVAPELLAKSFQERLVQGTGKFLKDTAKLDVVLRLTQSANYLTDRYILNKDVDVSKAWTDIDGTLQAAVLHSQNVAASHIVGAETSPFMTNEELTNLNKNTQRAIDIGKKLQDPNLTPEAKSLLEKEGERLKVQSDEIVNRTLDRLEVMPETDRKVVLDLTQKANNIKAEAQKVKDSDLSKEDKQIQLNELKRGFKRVFDKIEEINSSNRRRNDGFYSLSKSEQEKRITEVKKKAEESTGEKVTDREARYKAVIDYNAEQMKSDVFYYSTKHGDAVPTEIPEGYTSVKEVSNSEEAKRYMYQVMSSEKSASELEAIPFDNRTDTEHAEFIQKKTVEVLHERGFLNNEIKLVLSVMDARAEASGLGKGWYRQVENIAKGEFLQNTKIQNQLALKHGSPHSFPKEILVENEKGERQFLVGSDNLFPDVPEGYKVIEEYPNGRFRTDKMGTGEGQQAFGWGLYFTELEGIARNYAERLSDLKIDDKDFSSVIQDSIDYASGKEKILKTYNILKQKALDNGTPIKDFKTLKEFIDSDYLYEYANNVFGKNKLIKEIGSVDGFYNFLSEILDVAKENKAKLKSSKNLYDVTANKGKTPDQYTWLEWGEVLDEKTLNNLLEKDKDGKIQEALTEFYSRDNFIDSKKDLVDTIIYDEATGRKLYRILTDYLGVEPSQKDASLALLKSGIDGIKYPAESISRGATTDTARGFNYVVFDEAAVTIENKVQFQENQERLGALETLETGRKIIHFFDNAEIHTAIHELAHIFETELSKRDKETIQRWAGTEGWTEQTSEAFARGVERYFYDGIAPTNELKDIFQGIKWYLRNIYKNIKGSEIELDINPESRKVLDELFAKEEPTKTQNEKGVSLQDKVNDINNRVLESRSYEIVAELIKKGVIKEIPC
jgi:hypothetical protein